MNFDNKVLACAFFGDVSVIENGTKVPCKACGKNLTKPRSGYTAFIAHIDAHHAPVKEETYKQFQSQIVKSNGPMNKFVPLRNVSRFTLKLFSWMEWVIMGTLPISWCEDKFARKYSNILTDGRGEGLSRKTLAKYIDRVVQEVKQNVKKELPKSFGIVFDGWSCDGEHYLANFATWCNSSGGVVKRLLSCGVQDLPDGEILEDASAFGFGADDLGDYLIDVLDGYGHTLADVEFFSGDNCSVNQSLAEQVSNFTNSVVPLVGGEPCLSYLQHC